MKLDKIGIVVSALLLSAGCSNTLQTEEPMSDKALTLEQMQPALIVASSENTELLSMAMSKALNGTKVNLAPDTFTTTNKVSTERLAQDKIGQQGMNGRLMQRPDAENDKHNFMLYRHGDACYLVYEKTKEFIPIEGLTCKPN